jgi:hypothetical protein
MKKIISGLFVLALLTGCSSTEIVKTWREPSATFKPDPANKILVLAMVKDETSRRIIEDELVKRLGPNAVVSYNILTSDMLKGASEAALEDKIQRDKYTHVLMMRLADVEKETSYVPGTTTGFYGGYRGYYGYGAGYYSNPGYYQTDKNYFVETTVYSVSPDKLLWTGTTKTVNPSKVEKSVNEIADVVYEKMKQDGFLVQ